MPLSSLDRRIEAATGDDIDTLWARRDRGALDEPEARLVDMHRQLVDATTGVTFYRVMLHRLASGEHPVDGAFFESLERTIGQLREAADVRDGRARRVLAALEPIEAALGTAAGGEALSAADQVALQLITGGAKLYQHLVTGQLAVTTASGQRVSYADLQHLEAAGLVSRDSGPPVHAGQPVELTATGRAALLAARRQNPPPTAKAPAPPGAWPTTPPLRR
ncbi:hypothetical protein [Streptomyces cyaneofuscatus]|uniref:hypothetical protein n=1 Tax=Streptomyces cyaneofuscatus TaxID=66883 RepID=UPI003329390D